MRRGCRFCHQPVVCLPQRPPPARNDGNRKRIEWRRAVVSSFGVWSWKFGVERLAPRSGLAKSRQSRRNAERLRRPNFKRSIPNDKLPMRKPPKQRRPCHPWRRPLGSAPFSKYEPRAVKTSWVTSPPLVTTSRGRARTLGEPRHAARRRICAGGFQEVASRHREHVEHGHAVQYAH